MANDGVSRVMCLLKRHSRLSQGEPRDLVFGMIPIGELEVYSGGSRGFNRILERRIEIRL